MFPEDCEAGFTRASCPWPPPWGLLQSDHLLLREKPEGLCLLLLPLHSQTPACPSPTSTTASLSLGPQRPSAAQLGPQFQYGGGKSTPELRKEWGGGFSRPLPG